MPVIRKVPLSSGQIPNCGSANSGDHSSSVKKLRPDVLEEADRLGDERDHDPERRQRRDHRRGEQHGRGSPPRPSDGARRREGQALPAPRLSSACRPPCVSSSLPCVGPARRRPLRAERAVEVRASLASDACSSSIGTISEASAIVVVVVDHVLHERSHRRRVVGQLRAVRVHEQRPRQRHVLARLDRVRVGRDAAVAGIDRDQVQRVGVLLVVGEPEVTESTVVACDALDELTLSSSDGWYSLRLLPSSPLIASVK